MPDVIGIRFRIVFSVKIPSGIYLFRRGTKYTVFLPCGERFSEPVHYMNVKIVFMQR